MNGGDWFSRRWPQGLKGRLFARRQLDAWVLVVATVLLLLLFWILEPKWLNQDTLQLLVAQYTPLGLIAVAMTFSIIAGHIDLSPGSMIGLTGSVIGLVFTGTGNIWLSLLAGLGCAIGVGLLHSAFVAGLGINAIMVTLGTYIWARGLANGANAGMPITVGGGISNVVNASWGGFTLTAPLIIVVYLVAAYVLRRTRLGRYTYAMGGGQLSARRAGINVALYSTGVFMIMALMISLATFVTVGQLGSAAASAGTGMELNAIIAVVIGGSSLAGGTGSVGRTALGVAFIGILNSGLLNLGLTEAAFDLYSGLAFLAVLSVQVLIRRNIVEHEAVSSVLAVEPGI